MAEALLKKLKPDLEVDSAGLHVAIPVSKEVKDYLKNLNAERYLKSFSESLDEKNLRVYDLIVAMEPRHKNAVLRKCPECLRRIVVWNIDDPYFEKQEHAETIYHELENKVKKLAELI
jgi:protein-tyrosine-phosphatase